MTNLTTHIPHQLITNGDAAITIEYQAVIDEKLTEHIIQTTHYLTKQLKNYATEFIPGYQTLTVVFSPLKISIERFEQVLKELLEKPIQQQPIHGRLIQIPACYDHELAPDLLPLANYCQLSIKEVIHLHTQTTYLVHMLGFLPGFLYLGGLTDKLHCPRKSTPATRIPAGAIGIGGQQTGIYPVASPGGWNIIGQTPVNLFNPLNTEPFIAAPLDKIQFVPISKKEFIALKKKQS
ncbi:5-oxoprolinase subunit PxpB [Aliikangiella coralliicola]|uniref:5-oxoprolinase subunit PxpB n=1 Tax=Aliikangiella coralliicola TaxID=2592383 RepID=A0A545UK19_9GAMM|nr:5-oxoprolinase subunit PxpB [Aliikangiella coralliicola]TQV89808.1 5-oxoprolinase subunit PxpB [Aliikangiella coralliicola]